MSDITEMIKKVRPANAIESFKMNSEEVGAVARYWYWDDPEDGRLHIEWRDGRHWVYQGVPESVVRELLDTDRIAPEAVAPMAEEIDKKYQDKKIKDGKAGE